MYMYKIQILRHTNCVFISGKKIIHINIIRSIFFKKDFKNITLFFYIKYITSRKKYYS